jgi:hypothetical protein
MATLESIDGKLDMLTRGLLELAEAMNAQNAIQRLQSEAIAAIYEACCGEEEKADDPLADALRQLAAKVGEQTKAIETLTEEVKGLRL